MYVVMIVDSAIKPYFQAPLELVVSQKRTSYWGKAKMLMFLKVAKHSSLQPRESGREVGGRKQKQVVI
jgi:hypothetical protein